MTATFKGDEDSSFAGKKAVNLWKPWVAEDGSRWFSAFTFLPFKKKIPEEQQLDIYKSEPVFVRHWKLQSDKVDDWEPDTAFGEGKYTFKDNTPMELNPLLSWKELNLS